MISACQSVSGHTTIKTTAGNRCHLSCLLVPHRSVRQSVRHTSFPEISRLCFHIFGWELVASFYMKSKDQVQLSSRLTFFPELLPFVQNSVCHTSFSDFSWLCFHISGWNLVASFYIKSYRSSSTFVMVDLLYPELLPFVQNSVSPVFRICLVTLVNLICQCHCIFVLNMKKLFDLEFIMFINWLGMWIWMSTSLSCRP